MTRTSSPKAAAAAAATIAALLSCMCAVPATARAHSAVASAAAPLPPSTTLHAFLDPPVIVVANAVVTGPADPEVEFEQLQRAAHEESGSSRVGTGRGLLHGVRKPRNYPVCSKCALVSCQSRTECSGHCKRKGRLYTCKTRRNDSGVIPSITILRDTGPDMVTAVAPFVACMKSIDCALRTSTLKGSVDGAALVSAGARTFARCVRAYSSAGACLCTYATPDASRMDRFCETENGEGAPKVSSSFSVFDELEVRNGDQTVTVLVGAETSTSSLFARLEFEAGEEVAAADAVVTTVDEEFGGDYSLEDYSADVVEYDRMESFRRSSFLERVSTTPSRPLELELDEGGGDGEGGDVDEGGGAGAAAVAPSLAPLRVTELPGEGPAAGPEEGGGDGEREDIDEGAIAGAAATAPSPG